MSTGAGDPRLSHRRPGQHQGMDVNPQLPPRPFLGTDVATHGLSRARLRRLVREGEVRRLLRNVYVASDAPDTPSLRAAAAGLVKPEHVVVADHSAAWIHRVDSYSPTEHQESLTLEVVSIDGHEPTRCAGVLGGKRDLLRSEICEVDGVAVTTPVRTACDLARRRGRMAALAVLDAFMREHGITRPDLEAMLPRFRGRRGCIQLREMIGYADPARESMAESWTFICIVDAGCPPPESQVEVYVPGYGTVRLDLAYRWWKIAVEYDGEEFHTSPEDRRRDSERRAALAEMGWIVIVVTRHDLSGERLEAWLRQLRDAIADRRPTSTRRYSRAQRMAGVRYR